MELHLAPSEPRQHGRMRIGEEHSAGVGTPPHGSQRRARGHHCLEGYGELVEHFPPAAISIGGARFMRRASAEPSSAAALTLRSAALCTNPTVGTAAAK